MSKGKYNLQNRVIVKILQCISHNPLCSCSFCRLLCVEPLPSTSHSSPSNTYFFLQTSTTRINSSTIGQRAFSVAEASSFLLILRISPSPHTSTTTTRIHQSTTRIHQFFRTRETSLWKRPPLLPIRISPSPFSPDESFPLSTEASSFFFSPK